MVKCLDLKFWAEVRSICACRAVHHADLFLKSPYPVGPKQQRSQPAHERRVQTQLGGLGNMQTPGGLRRAPHGDKGRRKVIIHC